MIQFTHFLSVYVCSFDARGRFGRLAVAMKQSGTALGLGVDEDSALYINNGTAKVLGRYGVWVMDASNATFSDEPYFTVNGIRISYLSENDTYSFEDRAVTSSKLEITVPQGSAYESNSVFSVDEAFRSITTLVHSLSAAESVGYSRESGPKARVRFYKGLGPGGTSRGHYSPESGLYTVVDLLMDIGTRV